MSDPGERPPRRPRYRGKNPRRFAEKYKEHAPELYPETVARVIAGGKTPAGSHVPIMVDECLAALALQPGQTGVDATLGYGGHAARILRRITPGGRLLGMDVDPLEQPKTAARLLAMGFDGSAFEAVRSNYSGIAKVLAARELEGVDCSLNESVITAGPEERRRNPRSSAAKLRRAVKASPVPAASPDIRSLAKDE